MKSLRSLLMRTIIIIAALSLAACSAGSTGQTTTGTPFATQAPTAQPTVAKAKPTAPPPINLQWCQSVMTVADANQIMKPPTPITTIDVQSDAELGVCRYNSPQAQFAVVKILVEEKPYTGPHPVPQSTIVQLVTELAGEPGVTVSTATPVSGVGDQAEFLVASVSGNGMTFYVDAIYVIYGNVAFMCDDFHLNTKPSDAAQLSGLQQCGQRVVSQL